MSSFCVSMNLYMDIMAAIYICMYVCMYVHLLTFEVILYNLYLNLSSIDELGNWCHPRLVGPCANTGHSGEVPWKPCEREPALQAATNRHRHTEGTSVETYLTQYLP